jgi:hypothetical protein
VVSWPWEVMRPSAPMRTWALPAEPTIRVPLERA